MICRMKLLLYDTTTLVYVPQIQCAPRTHRTRGAGYTSVHAGVSSRLWSGHTAPAADGMASELVCISVLMQQYGQMSKWWIMM